MSLSVTAASIQETVNHMTTNILDAAEDFSNDSMFYCALEAEVIGTPGGLSASREPRVHMMLTIKDNTGSVVSRNTISPRAFSDLPTFPRGLTHSIVLKKSDDASSQELANDGGGITYEVGSAAFGGAGGEMIINVQGKIGAGKAKAILSDFGGSGDKYVVELCESTGSYEIKVPFVVS